MTNQDIIARADRYLAIVAWARKRYSRNHALLISRGYAPSRYSMIEDLAAMRYLENTRRHWADHTLKGTVA